MYVGKHIEASECTMTSLERREEAIITELMRFI